MNAAEIIALVKSHKSIPTMQTSAELCIWDAEQLLKAGNESGARERALKGLRYTVGCLSDEYRKAL